MASRPLRDRPAFVDGVAVEQAPYRQAEAHTRWSVRSPAGL
jgi:hypothetical protein